MQSAEHPAILGGKSAFDVPLPITRPTLPEIDTLRADLETVMMSGMITNSRFVGRFEDALGEYLGVPHVVAVSSCTSGLLLVLRSLGLQGDVVLPSFTFAATGHVALWNGLRVRFVDIDPDTFNIDPDAVERAMTPQTSAIIAVHIFGSPCDTARLEAIAARRGVRLVFDAAHALGSTRGGKKIGAFGDAEVFSLSPTKLVVAGEGGFVSTNDATLARLVRIGRDYGNPGNYDCEYAGLSARMGEFNALLGGRSLEQLEPNLARRHRLAQHYRTCLSNVPGVSFQEVDETCRSTYKDLAILVNESKFGLSRDDLACALGAEKIATRKYFDPPLHRQRAYREVGDLADRLVVTERVAQSTLCLPMFSHMEEVAVERVCQAISRIHDHGGAVERHLNSVGTRKEANAPA